jgi:hypothetical protein
MAEGTPTEILTILGWQIDTRHLIIQLQVEKADLWDANLVALIQDGDKGNPIQLKRLGSIQERSIHFARIIPGAMHFLSRMYSAIKRARRYQQTNSKLTDLILHSYPLQTPPGFRISPLSPPEVVTFVDAY